MALLTIKTGTHILCFNKTFLPQKLESVSVIVVFVAGAVRHKMFSQARKLYNNKVVSTGFI